MERKAFFDAIRNKRNWTVENVMGTEFLLDRMEEERIPVNDAAYMLATAWWETGQRMQPIDEIGGSNYFNKLYGPGTRVGKVLGNTKLGDGALFHGRGYVQLTGRNNYARASRKLNNDFVARPWLVKDPRYAWPIMRAGMSEGWFTGKSLDDYIDDVDESDSEDFREYKNARKIINGTDKDSTIAQLAVDFEYALNVSGYLAKLPVFEPPVKKPVLNEKVKVEVVKVKPIPPQKENWFMRLWHWIF